MMKVWRRWWAGGLVALALAALTGCVSAENEAKVAQAREAAGVRPERSRLSDREVRAFFVGKTRVTSAAHLGSQVSYMAPDGSVFLWFPGNRVILRGQWSIEETGGYRPYAGRPVSQVSVCFQYGPNTVNAFSGRSGGKTCVLAEASVRLVQDRADGDPFGLSERAEAPFVLPPERTTIASLRSRVGRT